MQYPNYRVAVEIVIIHESKILLTKRADDRDGGSGAWSVPSGKAKYEEIPIQALHREALEETNLEVELLKELDVRAIQSVGHDGEFYRLMFTYLVRPRNDDIAPLCINEEHSAFAWVTAEELDDENYQSVHDNLKAILKNLFSK
ncbi:NUDIX hydrolase [Candidatus Pristimantibacillus sp. PTI5]|uniref:NUDIX hydrolase n=1 Tax=Candidatus Pristimantibacillus sp. PTI5 TaxID=3400422 RepID=UPI003B026260